MESIDSHTQIQSSPLPGLQWESMSPEGPHKYGAVLRILNKTGWVASVVRLNEGWVAVPLFGQGREPKCHRVQSLQAGINRTENWVRRYRNPPWHRRETGIDLCE